MLHDIRTELGPDFFSDGMMLTPEERAKEDAKKFADLRAAVYWGEIEKLPKLIRNGTDMYAVDDPVTKKTLIHIAAQRNQAASIRRLYELRSLNNS